MKTLLALLLALPASAGFEALKGADLAASWRAAVKLGVPAPAAPKAKATQTRLFERTGFIWESDAKTAASEAESGLRAAGLPVLSSQVYSENCSPSRYGIKLEYVEDPYPRPLDSYQRGYFDFESDARVALNAATSNLTGAGYHVILGRTWRQADPPWDYYYTVDFVARRRY